MNRLFTKSEYLKLREGLELSFDNMGKLPFTKEACAEALKNMREFRVGDRILIGYKTEEGEYIHEYLSCGQRYGKGVGRE